MLVFLYLSLCLLWGLVIIATCAQVISSIEATEVNKTAESWLYIQHHTKEFGDENSSCTGRLEHMWMIREGACETDPYFLSLLLLHESNKERLDNVSSYTFISGANSSLSGLDVLTLGDVFVFDTLDCLGSNPTLSIPIFSANVHDTASASSNYWVLDECIAMMIGQQEMALSMHSVQGSYNMMLTDSFASPNIIVEQ
jgi:hypothetical protein